MIWVGGRLVADDALSVSVLDRTFEHGLGLFETLRTWNRRAPLLDRHLARMTRSARALGIPLDHEALPGPDAVAELLGTSAIDGDAMLRITLTGGLSDSGGSVVWMRALPLPPPLEKRGADLEVGFWRVDYHDRLARHKSLNYWRTRLEYEAARAQGVFDEVVSQTGDGRFWEGSRSNLFLVSGDRLLTPPQTGPIVPGIMRSLVLERAQEIALKVESGDVKYDQIVAADELFLTNSVRGLIPVASIGGHNCVPQGPVFRRLHAAISEWLMQGAQP